MTKKIYMERCMYSPLNFNEFLRILNKKYKFIIVNNPRAADIIMSSYIRVLTKYVKLYQDKKKYLLWTHEPYHDFNTKPIKVVKTIKKRGIINTNVNVNVNIMNVYTKNVFLHNYRYFYFNILLPHKQINAGDENILLKDWQTTSTKDSSTKMIVTLSTYYDLWYYNKNPYSLLPLRYQLIEEAYNRGIIDVYGKGWENHKIIKSTGNSRNDNDRRDSKKDILSSGYLFNICTENTDAKWYITEKIWECIAYGTLPIYKGSTETIKECFKDKSYINIDDYKTIPDLFKYIENMNLKEYKQRYNSCVDSFNDVIKNKLNNKWRGDSKDLNINYLEYKTCFDALVKKLRMLK